jgi:hypothetical protein
VIFTAPQRPRNLAERGRLLPDSQG